MTDTPQSPAQTFDGLAHMELSLPLTMGGTVPLGRLLDFAHHATSMGATRDTPVQVAAAYPDDDVLEGLRVAVDGPEANTPVPTVTLPRDQVMSLLELLHIMAASDGDVRALLEEIGHTRDDLLSELLGHDFTRDHGDK